MKKIVLSWLLMISLLLGFAACGSVETGSTPASASDTEASSANETADDSAADDISENVIEESSEEEVEDSTESELESASVTLPLSDQVETVTYWIPMPPADSNGVSPADVSFNAYMLEETNVQIDFVGPPANAATENFNIMIASGDYPDMIEKFGNYYSAGYESAVEQEIIQDVTELIDAYMPNYKAAMTATEDRVLAVTTDNGYIPGFASFYQDTADDETVAAGYGLVIRSDWLEEQGLDTPNTYDDYYEVLSTFRDAYGATMWLPPSGFMSNNVFVSGFQTGGLSSGSTTPFFVDDSGTVFYGPLKDGYYEYVSLMAQWYSEGLIYPDFSTAVDEQNPDSELYSTGTVGLFGCSYRAYSSLLSQYPELGFAPARNPLCENGDDVHIGASASSNSIAVVMSTDCSNSELCAKLVDWMFTDEAVFHASYGFENEAYTLNSEGEPVFTELITNNPDHEATEALAAYSLNYLVWYTDPSIEQSLQGDAYLTSTEIWGTNNGSDWNLPATVTMSEEESSTFSDTYADIETYVAETVLKWIVGQEPLTEDAYNAFCSTIESMGIQTCIEAKQTAYDRYCQRGI